MVLKIKYFGSKSERSNFLYSFYKTVTTHSVNEENSYKEKDFIIFSPAFVLKDQINHELHFLMYFVL